MNNAKTDNDRGAATKAEALLFQAEVQVGRAKALAFRAETRAAKAKAKAKAKADAAEATAAKPSAWDTWGGAGDMKEWVKAAAEIAEDQG